MPRMNLMLTTTLQDRLRRASALTGLEPAEMARCAISEWLQRLEQPWLPFHASVEPPRADLSPAPSPARPKSARKTGRLKSAGKEES